MSNGTAGLSESDVAARAEVVLPEQVTVALNELAGAAREGLLALACGIGLEVMGLLMYEDVGCLVGPKGRYDPGQVAVRHGSEAGSVVLGGRRVSVAGVQSVTLVEGEEECQAPRDCSPRLWRTRRPFR